MNNCDMNNCDNKRAMAEERLRQVPVKRVLFVCLGNICRSPAAQGVMQSIVDAGGASSSWV